jgi:hypothetical protein
MNLIPVLLKALRQQAERLPQKAAWKEVWSYSVPYLHLSEGYKEVD